MIERNYTTAASSYRLVPSSDDTREYSASATVTTKGMLLPASAEDEALLEGSYQEVRKFLCPLVDIQIGDKVVINSEDFFVGGRRRYDNDIVRNQHLELVLHSPN